MKHLILATMIASGAFASPLFVSENTALMSQGNEPLARITKGTKVDVLKEAGEKVLVKIQGWSYEETPNLDIYPQSGLTVVLASLEEQKVGARKIIQTKEDEYEEVWMENSVTGWVKKAELTTEFSSIWKRENTLASERCSGCHEAPSATHHFPGEFPSLLDSMKEQAGLTDVEKELLVNFYQKNNIYHPKK